MYWSDEVQREELALIAGKGTETADAKGDANDTEVHATEAAEADDELAAVQTELAEIKKTRRENPKEYDSERMEARELELLDRREILQAGAEGLPQEVVDRWRRSGGLAHNMQKALEVASRAGDEFDSLAAIVEALPAEASVAITDAMRLEYPPVRGSEEQRLAVADQRLGRILSMLPPKVADDVEAKMRAMPRAQLEAIRRVLVG
jgi:hypothetical protein